MAPLRNNLEDLLVEEEEENVEDEEEEEGETDSQDEAQDEREQQFIVAVQNLELVVPDNIYRELMEAVMELLNGAISDLAFIFQIVELFWNLPTIFSSFASQFPIENGNFVTITPDLVKFQYIDGPLITWTGPRNFDMN